MFSLPKHVLLLDIETNGLKRERDQIISIGVLYNSENNQPEKRYWFLENKEEEKNILEDFLLFLQDFKILYTYYGKGFDYPFLLSRIVHHNIDTADFLAHKLIDMKDALKHFSNNRQHFEAAINFQRQSSTKGKDVINLYRTYETSKVPVYKDLILKHQSDELSSLFAFYELYHLLFHMQELSCIEQKIEDCHLILGFKTSSAFSFSFSESVFDWQFSFNQGELLLMLTIPLAKVSLKQYLEPSKDYYYIESQGQIVHKSLAQFIPASQRRKAAKEDCVIRKDSVYLKIFTSYKVTVPIWYDSLKSMYIEASDFSLDLLYAQLFSLFFQNTSGR